MRVDVKHRRWCRCTLDANAHEIALGVQMAIADFGVGMLGAHALEIAPGDGPSVAPRAHETVAVESCAASSVSASSCASLGAGAYEAALGTPAVPTADAEKACAGDGAGGSASALEAGVFPSGCQSEPCCFSRPCFGGDPNGAAANRIAPRAF